MATIQSNVSQNSTVYRENYTFFNNKLKEYNEAQKKCHWEGEDKYIERHRNQGKYLARERIQKLIDPGKEFLELMTFAGWGQKGISPGASLVTGLASIHNVNCLVCANVPTIKGGALNPFTVAKMKRVDEIAKQNQLPTVYLVESAGADLPFQAQVYNAGGSVFREITRRSKVGIPSVSIVFGSSTAGGAYIPGMSDYTIMVKNNSKMFLAGPPLVKMAIDQDTTDEALGGALMHSTTSGVSDYLADNEDEAIEKARSIVSLFPGESFVNSNYEEPLFPADELLGIVSEEGKKPYDVREVVLRLVDGSEYFEFKRDYGTTLFTGFANIHGVKIGIIGNNGVLWPESALKGTHFIELCNQRNIPLLFLQNITGFMVGEEVEQTGIIKEGAKMINAVSNSEVPAITLIIGASYGAGNYAMCGRAFEPRFLFSWPSSRLAVMGPSQMAGVLEILQREKAKKAKKSIDENELAKSKIQIEEMVRQQSDPLFVSGQVWDDGILDPRDTRSVLGRCFELLNKSDSRSNNKFGVFRM